MLRLREVRQRTITAKSAPVPALDAILAAAESEAASLASVVEIISLFDDPLLELIRMLREASEIEHALMLQYLYAAYSVKPEYDSIVGQPTPRADILFGVAIQEMEHLAIVNRFLVALGAAPNLARQDFPYEFDIYPFEFNLEPLSRHSVAKYTFAEAPRAAVQPAPGDLTGILYSELTTQRLNQIGSLYRTVLGLVDKLLPEKPELQPFRDELDAVLAQGEVDHFAFFKSLLLGTHSAFGGQDVWSLPVTDAAYPSRPLPVNPSAIEGHPNQIQDETLRRLAFLADLDYWIIVLLLDAHFRFNKPEYRSTAIRHMRATLNTLGKHLAERNMGVPFDPLDIGYAPALNEAGMKAMTRRLVLQAKALAAELAADLPQTFPAATYDRTLQLLEA